MTVASGLFVSDRIYCKGGGNGTHFPYSDGENYIRGHTNHNGDLKMFGKMTGPNNNLVIDSNSQVNGTISAGGVNTGAINATAINCASIKIGNTVINEMHLQILTSQKAFTLYHSGGYRVNANGERKYLHVGGSGNGLFVEGPNMRSNFTIIPG